MKDWFDSLQIREQVFVGVGGVVVVLTLAWGLLWLPFDKGHEALRANLGHRSDQGEVWRGISKTRLAAAQRLSIDMSHAT